MDEDITKAQQTVNLLESDIVAAFHKAHLADHGAATRYDHALRIVLSDLLGDVRKLQSKLLDLGTA